MPVTTGTLAPTLPPEAFTEEVRGALDHLYDYAYLHNHQLAWRLCGATGADGVMRAQRVRTLLLDAIEQLRPEPRVSTDAMRAYAILTYRCIEGMAMDEIAAKLGLSRRQAYREYAKGVEAVACFAWDTLSQDALAAGVRAQAAPPLPAVPSAGESGAQGESTRLDAAAQEVARLTSSLLPESVDLPALAASVAELLAPRTLHTGVALRVAQSVEPAAVVADRALLRQALLNLFSYALDQACRGGEVTVTSVHEERGVALQLASCAGAGEPPLKREGVGVTVAQKLIEAMGGQAHLEQAAGEWRYWLWLPAAQRDTVLVVDDNADLTVLFQRYAAGHHLNVVGATSGVQALELAQELHPQLILLDLMLSQMDGWEILQRLRSAAATRATPIVICSVLNEPDLAFSLGASDYVTKPISQAALVDVLRRWLGKLHPAV